MKIIKMITTINMKIFKKKKSQSQNILFCLFTTLMLLSGCSSYSSSFSCPDAQGVRCTPMHIVDQMIKSGEIEKISRRKKCKGSVCGAQVNQRLKPDLKEPTLQPVIIEETEEEIE